MYYLPTPCFPLLLSYLCPLTSKHLPQEYHAQFPHHVNKCLTYFKFQHNKTELDKYVK